MRSFVILILAMLSAFAQSAPEKPAIPTIPAEVRARFWRALAEQKDAAARLEKAARFLEDAQKALQSACGDRLLIADQSGEPACGELPKKDSPGK